MSHDECVPGTSETAPSRRMRKRSIDGIAIAALFMTGLAIVAVPTSLAPRELYAKAVGERWFQADTLAIMLQCTQQNATQSRTAVHPLATLLAYPSILAIKTAFGVVDIQAIWIFQAMIAGFWMTTIYLTLRGVRLRPLDASLYTLIAGASAGSLFWFSTPESYPMGSLSLILPLCLVTWSDRRAIPPLAFLLGAALSLSITVTNAMSGFVALFFAGKPRRAASLIAAAVALVMILYAVQKYAFPSAYNPDQLVMTLTFVGHPDSGGPVHKARGILFHSVVAPAFSLTDGLTPRGPMLTMQGSRLGSSGVVGSIATVLWTGLLALGLVSLARSRSLGRFRIMLGFLLTAQVALHLIYGDETFLYALHFVPLLVITTAMTSLTRWRTITLAAASILLVCLVVNNGQVMARALATTTEDGQPDRLEIAPLLETLPPRPFTGRMEFANRILPDEKLYPAKPRRITRNVLAYGVVGMAVACLAAWTWRSGRAAGEPRNTMTPARPRLSAVGGHAGAAVTSD